MYSEYKNKGGRIMKKFSAIFVALVLVAVSAVSAFAAGINSNEQAVIDKLGEPIAMKDGNMTFPDEFVNQMENYFNTIDMTADESADIIAVLEEGQSFLENSGAANIADLSLSQKYELLDYGQRAVGVIGMTMTYDKETKTLYIYDPEGNTAFAATPALSPVGGSTNGGSGSGANTGVIKTTGADSSFAGFAAVGAVAVVLVAGAAVYFVKTKRERA